MASDTISEANFLLTELRYTLGQLHVQVLDLDAATRSDHTCDGHTVDQILTDMVRYEKEYQQRYSQMLGVALTQDTAGESIPLPIEQTEELPGIENTFEHLRAHTISMLEHIGEDWSQDLLDAVKQQVQQDRQHTTQIAECRKSFFEHDQRPDLNEPLTAAT